LWLLSVEGRFVRLAVMSASAQWSLRWALGERRKTTYAGEPKQEMEARVWFHRYRTLLTERAIVVFSVAAVVFMAVLACSVYLSDTTLKNTYAPDCAGWPYYPFYVFTGINLFMLLGLAVVIRTCKDAYGIRTELYVTVVVTSISLLLVMTMDDTNVHQWFGDWYASSWIWLLVGLAISDLYSHVYPLIRIVRGCAHTDLEAAEFSTMLSTPDLFEEFKAFSVTDFTIELVLFHEHYVHFCHTFTMTKDGMSRSSIRLLRDMYHTFIKPGAIMELGVDGIHQVRKRYQSHNLDKDMFNQVEIQVLALLKWNTFPRFIQHRTQ
jgi:hypothetical protein